MKIKIELAIAMLIGMLLGVFICSGGESVRTASADEYAPARNQLLRAEDRQARALESIANSLRNIDRKTR